MEEDEEGGFGLLLESVRGKERLKERMEWRTREEREGRKREKEVGKE